MEISAIVHPPFLHVIAPIVQPPFLHVIEPIVHPPSLHVIAPSGCGLQLAAETKLEIVKANNNIAPSEEFPISVLELHRSALLASGERLRHVESQPAVIRCHAFIQIVAGLSQFLPDVLVYFFVLLACFIFVVF